MDLSALLTAYEQIAKVGLPFLLFIAGVANYYGIWEWSKPVRARELKSDTREAALEAKYKAEIAEIKAAAAQREAAQQARIDQLFEKMLDAAGLIEKSARQAARL